jgi:cation transport ATPase
MSRLRWNYTATLGINFTLVLLGITGRISPSVSALMHNLATIVVTLNSLRSFDDVARTGRLSSLD